MVNLQPVGTNGPELPLLVSVIAAFAWAASSVIAAVNARTLGWVVVAHLATGLTLCTALRDSSQMAWVGTLLAAYTVCAVLATAAAQGWVRPIDTSPTTEVSRPVASPVELGAVAFGALYALSATVATVGLSPLHLSIVLVAIGVLTLGYAASPDRLLFAYVGSLIISVGTANLMLDANVGATEAYTAPLVVLLAGIGFLEWTRNRALPTTLTMGPALSVAMGPSLLAGLRHGDALRLSFVTAVAIVLLLVGLSKAWKAPVTAGAGVIVVVAITQGGPYLSYVPGWAILAVGGIALVAAGVAWEKAVNARRVANNWYATLV